MTSSEHLAGPSVPAHEPGPEDEEVGAPQGSGGAGGALPDTGSVSNCPMCGQVTFMAVVSFTDESGNVPVIPSTHYHEGPQPKIISLSPQAPETWPCQGAFEVGRHLCRRCVCCGYRWMERVVQDRTG